VSFLAPWFLAGFAALVPLVLLHLRRQRREVGVASLLLWRDLPGVATPRRRRARVVLPVALALQALLLVLAVLALTAPQFGGGTPTAGAAPFVAVIDGSTRMAMTDIRPDRLAAARRTLEQRIAALPADTPVSVVVAGPAPRLVTSRVSPEAARAALDDVRADAPTADLTAGLRLAAGELHRPGGTIALLHAEGEPAPTVRARGVSVDVTSIGDRADNQILTPPVARCDGEACSVLTGVRNEASEAVDERLVVERDGREIGARRLTVAPDTTADVEIAAEPGSELSLRLDREDALPDDNHTTVAIPDPDAPLTVALVAPDAAPALTHALSALPGVTIRRVASGDPVGAAGVVVYDRVAPPTRGTTTTTPSGAPVSSSTTTGGPPALIVAPPSLPGGRVGAPLADPTLTGTVPGAALLEGVDLAGLVVERGGVRRIGLPASLPAVAWAAGGPLLADDGHTTLLAIDPTRSNLPQLPAFPLLLANVVDRARGLSPRPAPVAEPASVTLRASDGGALAPDDPADLWPWLVGATLLVLLLETALTAEWRILPAGRAQSATRREGGR
jgi:hypothetical protein